MTDSSQPVQVTTEESAFPIVHSNGVDSWTQQCGLSKRELFAAMAVQGAMAGLGALSHEVPDDEPVDPDAVAIDAVKMADALLRELAEPAKKDSRQELLDVLRKVRDQLDDPHMGSIDHRSDVALVSEIRIVVARAEGRS